MTKIPDIRKMQQITESSHLQLIETEREIVCKEIEKAANKGHHYLYIDTDLFNENVELLKNEGYEVQRKCNEWSVGTVISWYPTQKRRKKEFFIFNF